MPQTPEAAHGSEDVIKVGSTGTINSLMSKELESTKDSPHPSSSSRRKLQDPPVSVPCGYSPRKAQLKKIPSNDPSSSSSSNCSESSSQSPRDTQKPKPKSNSKRNEHVAPMLTTTTTTTTTTTLEKNASGDKPKKKGHTYIAEVVDLKCNSPMSNRLKKLGFSKLNESTI